MLLHLSDTQPNDVCVLVNKYPELFNDIPTQTTILQHDVEVAKAAPVKQHAYRVNPMKQKIMFDEVAYLLDHGLARPS